MVRYSIAVFTILIVLISFISCKSKMTKSDDPFDQEMERRMLLETKAKSTNKTVAIEKKETIVPTTATVNSFIRNAELRVVSNEKLIGDLKKKENPSTKLTRKISNLEESNFLLKEKIRLYKEQVIKNQQDFEADVTAEFAAIESDFTSIYDNKVK